MPTPSPGAPGTARARWNHVGEESREFAARSQVGASPLDKRRGPATTPAPVNAAAAKLQVPAQGTASVRQNAVPQVWAMTIEVAGKQRSRLEMFVWCRCGARHAHRAPVTFVAGVRRGPCGMKYVVRAAVVLNDTVAA